MYWNLGVKSLLAASLAAAVLAVGAATGSLGSNLTKQSNAMQATAARHVAPAPKVSPAEAARAVSSAKELALAFRLAADKVMPSVVSIENTPKVVSTSDNGSPNMENPLEGPNPFEGTPFERFFKDSPMG